MNCHKIDKKDTVFYEINIIESFASYNAIIMGIWSLYNMQIRITWFQCILPFSYQQLYDPMCCLALISTATTLEHVIKEFKTSSRKFNSFNYKI